MLTAILLYFISPVLCLGYIIGGGLNHHHHHRCDDD
jgi:hypothetical protein